MPLRVPHNLAASNAQRSLGRATRLLEGSYARISSGLRIRVAADDAAGLGISERMRAQVRGYDAAGRNAQDGISLLQTAEGGLSEVSEMLTRMRELSVQAASGTLTTEQRLVLNAEFQGLKNEIDRLARTEFNGIRILSNTNRLDFQVGIDSGQTISIYNADVRTVSLGITSDGVGTVANANAALGHLDDAIASVAGSRGSRAATLKRLELARSNSMTASQNLAAAESRIRDADLARELSLLVRNQILQAAAVAVLAQAQTTSVQAISLLTPSS